MWWPGAWSPTPPQAHSNSKQSSYRLQPKRGNRASESDDCSLATFTVRLCISLLSPSISLSLSKTKPLQSRLINSLWPPESSLSATLTHHSRSFARHTQRGNATGRDKDPIFYGHQMGFRLNVALALVLERESKKARLDDLLGCGSKCLQ
jgi:hypothetical protein